MFSAHFLAALGSAELLNLVAETTFFGKFIMLVLFVISVLAWAVLVEKGRVLSGIRKGHLEFWRECDAWLAGQRSREELARWCERRPDLPLCNQVVETEGMGSAPAVRRASERVAYLEIERLERYLIVLATTVTIAPFLGLMGTVWGIMTSFWDMASSQSASLTVVAPGIAEALITTIMGLATAIPAVIFYNMLVRKIDLVGNEMERLRTILEEEVGGGGTGTVNGHPARRPAFHEKERI
ncbi:MAG: MotA/TolQ/ExbB proton channel family protein [Candidatus Krumholzibacteriia bacterium]